MILSLGFIGYIFCLPKPLFKAPYSVVLEDQQGQLLAARIAEDGQWRFPALDTLPEKFSKALVLFEDQRFNKHIGIDFRAIFRALQQNIRSGDIVSGASTLSMQVIRMARGPRRRNIWNKLVEMTLATRLEIKFTKAEILNLYAAHAPFGGNVVGLDAASWRYFGKNANQLSWAEAATLAVLPNTPAIIHPGRNRNALKEKRNRLLSKLKAAGYFDELTLDLAISEPIPDQPLALPQHSPHLLQKLVRDYKAQRITSPRIRSSIDLELQQNLNTKVRQYQELLRYNNIHNAAAVLIHIPSNTIKAYVGNAPGAGNDHGEMVDIIEAPRSTGSILKPLLYGLALEDGLILPNSLIADIPINLNGYRPENYSRTFSGASPAGQALSRSLNVPFVYLLKMYGLERFHLQLRRMGMRTLTESPNHYGLTLILGGAEGNLLDITSMYAGLSRTLSVFTKNSSQYLSESFKAPSYIPPPSGTKQKFQAEPNLLGAGAVWSTIEAMQEVQRPSSEGNWETFHSSRKIAWKTGTSFGFRDAWAVGITPEYALGVWVGNADGEGRPGLVGVQAAAPLLFDIFDILPGGSWFDPPYDDLRQARICPLSGNLAQSICPVDSTWVPISKATKALCTQHQNIHLDQNGTYQVNMECYSPFLMKHQAWFILPPLQAYYFKQLHPWYKPLPPLAPNCQEAISDPKMELIYPREPNRIMVPKDIDGSLSRVVFEVAHSKEESKLYWHIDETFVGSTQFFHSMEFNPDLGPHLLTVVDERGNRLEQRFEIVGKDSK